MSIVLEKPISNYQFFISNYRSDQWFKVPDGYEKYISLKKQYEEFNFAIVDKETQILVYYRKFENDLRYIEEMILTDTIELDRLFGHISKVSSEDFPKLLFLLEGTRYRNLSHRELIDTILTEVDLEKHDNFFVSYHKNDMKPYPIERIENMLRIRIEDCFKMTNDLTGLGIKFYYLDDSVKSLKSFIDTLIGLIGLPHFPAANKKQTLKLLKRAINLYELVKDFPFD
jgi:hypothetical protein